MDHQTIGRPRPSDNASLGRDRDKLDCDQGGIDVVLTRGNKYRIQSFDTVVVAMIDGDTSVRGRITDDMPVDERPSRVGCVQVLSRQHRQRQ